MEILKQNFVPQGHFWELSKTLVPEENVNLRNQIKEEYKQIYYSVF